MTRSMGAALAAAVSCAAAAVMASADAGAGAGADGTAFVPPARLADTGLYADPAARALAPGVLPYAPQYPLWSDGAQKRRFIRLPSGSAVDARDPDAWRFPPGTRFWKEFATPDGRPIETRLMVLGADGATWTFATYVWSADGRDARLAPERGAIAEVALRPGVPYEVPGVADCRACHEGKPNRVLGFDALQLSPDRDPLAPNAAPPPSGALDLRTLAARGLVRGLSPALLAHPPRIPAATPRARAALGWLHGNCSSCHNARGPLAPMGLSFEQRVAAPDELPGLRTTVGVPSAYHGGAGEAPLRIAPGDPGASVLLLRVGSRQPLLQMPPLGSRAADPQAVDLLTAWIRELGSTPSPTQHSQEEVR